MAQICFLLKWQHDAGFFCWIFGVRPTQMVVSRKSPCYLLNPKDEKQSQPNSVLCSSSIKVRLCPKLQSQSRAAKNSSGCFSPGKSGNCWHVRHVDVCRWRIWIMLSCCSIESSPGLANLHTSGDAHRQSQQLVFPGAKQIETTSTESTAQDHPLSAK